jgi:uncharacterized membrane protein YozB (DUF420 family)
MISLLPHLNAILNGSSALLASAAYIFIRKKKIVQHRLFMISATALSLCFLISYLTYHYEVGTVRLQKQGWIRPVYFTILISHTILAMSVIPLVILALRNAFAGRFSRHKSIARLTLPIWLYVSVTGVLIYFILYH